MVILLALGLSLLAIVGVQAALGVGPLGSSAVADRPAITLVPPTPRPLPPVLDVQGHNVALAPPPTVKPLTTDPALGDLVKKHLGDLRGVFGVAIQDLDSGQGVLVNADREFPAASLFKLPVMYEIYRQRDAGRLSLADLLPLSANYTRQDLGTLDVPTDTLVSIGWALDRMVTRSDNATANLLLDKAGAANVNNTLRDLGLQETRISGDKLTTSPRDMLHLMEVIVAEQGLKKESSVEIIQTLLAQTVNDRLPAQLPRDTPVAHKTGNLDTVVHDVGIVYSPGATLVIALLAAETQNAAEVARAEAALTRAVYDHFNAAGSSRPRSTFRPPDASRRPTPVPPFLPAGAAGTLTPSTAGLSTPTSAGGLSTPTTSSGMATATLPASFATPVETVVRPATTAAPAPTVAVAATAGRSEAPTVGAVEPTRAITAVRPTVAAAPTEPARSVATAVPPAAAPNGSAPVVTAVRPTAVPPAVAPPAAPTTAPVAPAAPVATAPPAAPVAPAATAVRAPDVPRFGASTPTSR